MAKTYDVVTPDDLNTCSGQRAYWLLYQTGYGQGWSAAERGYTPGYGEHQPPGPYRRGWFTGYHEQRQEYYVSALRDPPQR